MATMCPRRGWAGPPGGREAASFLQLRTAVLSRPVTLEGSFVTFLFRVSPRRPAWRGHQLSGDSGYPMAVTPLGTTSRFCSQRIKVPPAPQRSDSSQSISGLPRTPPLPVSAALPDPGAGRGGATRSPVPGSLSVRPRPHRGGAGLPCPRASQRGPCDHHSPVWPHPSCKPPLGPTTRPKVCEAVSWDRSRGLWRPGAWSRPRGPARPAPQPQTHWEEGLPKPLALHTAAAAPPSAAPGAQTEAVGGGHGAAAPSREATRIPLRRGTRTTSFLPAGRWYPRIKSSWRVSTHHPDQVRRPAGTVEL